MLDRDGSRRGVGGRWATVIVGAVVMSASAVSSVEAGRPHGRGEPPTYLAEIRRTAYGVPHIKANDDGVRLRPRLRERGGQHLRARRPDADPAASGRGTSAPAAAM